MASYHSCIVMGHIGRDPETRYLQDGTAICNFSVAVTEKFKDKENTTWYRVNAFSKLAEICSQYLHKGDPVLIVGRMQCRKYEDKSGNQRESWELRADQMQMLGSKKDKDDKDDAPKPTQKQREPGEDPFGDLEDDLPF